MYNREIIEQYVQATIEYDSKLLKLQEVLRVFNPENELELMPYSYYTMVNNFVVAHIGETKFESLMNWIYDSVDAEGIRSVDLKDETGTITVTSFDDYYSIIFDGVKISDILSR